MVAPDERWTVICYPVENNPSDTGTNENGLAVYLRSGDVQKEVGRVAFLRRNARNPDISFIAALQDALDRAEEAATTLNELYEEFDRIRAEAMAIAQARIEELFVNVPGQLS